MWCHSSSGIYSFDTFVLFFPLISNSGLPDLDHLILDHRIMAIIAMKNEAIAKTDKQMVKLEPTQKPETTGNAAFRRQHKIFTAPNVDWSI